MNLFPATFLAGSLLTLLIPTIMLTALVVWYTMFIRRVPETEEGDKPGLPDATASPDETGTPVRTDGASGPTSP